MSNHSVFVPENKILTIITHAAGSADYSQLDGSAKPIDYNTISSDTTLVLGPFTSPKSYRISFYGEEGSFSIGEDVPFNNQDVGEVSGQVISNAVFLVNGSQQVFLADLATDADGTAIAASVNAIRDALVAVGILAQEEV